MKRTLLASAAAVAVITTPAFADGGTSMRDGDYWYVGLSAGANDLHDISASTAFSWIYNTDFDTGYALSANVGYRWPTGLRAEVEFTYRDNNVSSLVANPGGPASSPDGDVTQYTLMANVLYDFHVLDDVNLSLGAGLGASDASFDIHGYGVPVIVDAGSSNWSFAWQLIAGASYSMSPDTEFFVEYKYMRNDNLDVTTFPTGIPLGDTVDAQNQTVSLGIRLALGR